MTDKIKSESTQTDYKPADTSTLGAVPSSQWEDSNETRNKLLCENFKPFLRCAVRLGEINLTEDEVQYVADILAASLDPDCSIIDIFPRTGRLIRE